MFITMGVHAAKSLRYMYYEKGSTTRVRTRTLQAIGSGNRLPLTYNDEGEEIVYSHKETCGSSLGELC